MGFSTGQLTLYCSEQRLVSCTSFNPQVVSPKGVPASTVLTITASSAVAGSRAPAFRSRVPPTLAYGATFASFVVGFVLISIPGRNRITGALFALLSTLAVIPVTGCGGGSGSARANPQGQTAVITVSAGTNCSSTQSLSLTVIVPPWIGDANRRNNEGLGKDVL